jgi:Ni/Co efflux regulator RcnB
MLFKKTANTLLAAIMLSLATAPVYADKPEWAGGGKNKGGDQGERGNGGGKDERKGNRHGGNRGSGSDVNVNIGAYFGGSQRQAVHDYYGSQFKSGKCPPGLAKKNNGCQPPGQAKKWSRGYALPSDIAYYPVPSALVTRLGPPPSGYKYVRVASDILLITIGTSMVVDAIEDLGGL